MTQMTPRRDSPAVRAVAGLIAVYAPIAAALLAGLEPVQAVSFVIGAWATEWLIAYAFVRGESLAERSSQRTSPAALGAPSATNE